MGIDAQQKRHLSPMQMAALGYQESQRKAELDRKPAKASLRAVLQMIRDGQLPQEYRGMALQPPTKEELAYLPRDIQLLTERLTMLDKLVGALPKQERTVRELEYQAQEWTEKAAQLRGYREPPSKGQRVLGVNYPLNLDAQKETLKKFQSEQESILKGLKQFKQTNPTALTEANQRLDLLRKESQAPQSFSEAEAGLQPLKKTTLQWLHDLKHKGNWEEKIQALNVLKSAEIDVKQLMKDEEQREWTLLDKAVAEQRQGTAQEQSSALRQQVSGSEEPQDT